MSGPSSLPLFPAAMKVLLPRACVTRPLEAFPHRRERRAGFRNRPSRESRVSKLRSVFSACSARSSHWCCSCSNRALVTESTAASAAAAHLRANCRRYSGRALMQHPTGAGCGYRSRTAFPLCRASPAGAYTPRLWR